MSVMVKINIPKNIHGKILEKIEGTSIQNVEDYLILLLEREFPNETEFSAEEEKLIRERLRRLGYLE
jgi:hypothetical protein